MKRLLVTLVAVLMLAGMAGTASGSGGPVFKQPVWFDWDHAKLSVLIIPPTHGQLVNDKVLNGLSPAELNPIANSYVKATEAAIGDWRKAVKTFGSLSLQRRFKISSYVLGRDSVPTSVMTNPDIVVAWNETTVFILGISFNSDPCLSTVSKFFVTSFSYPDMYSVAGHEFGHCLGLDHSYGTGETIKHDILYATYEEDMGSSRTAIHKPSNLNVATLERVFDGKDQADVVSMRASQYKHLR